MTFKQLIRKNILFEDITKDTKKNKNNLNIFYKINLRISNTQDLDNDQEEQPVQQQVDQAAPPAAEGQPVLDQQAAPIQAPGSELPPIPVGIEAPTLPVQASVVTEADDKEDVTKITNESEIVRKVEDQIVLNEDEIDRIQTIEDLVELLGNKKDKNGEEILDEFSVETIQTMISPDAAQKAASLIDRKDYIFLDLIYGHKKDENSIGLRISKRKNSDSVSLMILKDNELMAVPFNLTVLNNQIATLRNDFVTRGKDTNN